MTREELYKRLTDIEWDDFEVKEAKSELPKSIWETVSAFSNTSGGWIVDTGGNVQNTFIRSGSGDQRASDMEIAALFREQSFGTKSEQVVEGSSIDDIDPNSLATYRNHIRNFNTDFLYNNLSDKEFLLKTGFMKEDKLTYGGLLFLGKYDRVRFWIDNFWIDYIEIPGLSYSDAAVRYSYRMPEQANIWESYNVLIQRLRIHVDAPFTAGPNGFSPDDNTLLYSLREGLINMLAHADYFSPMHPTIRKYDNRIEFQNPGRFMFDLKEVRTQMHSMPRNPNIIKFFRYPKLAENAGYGIDKMLIWERYKNKTVDFQSNIVSSTVTYFFDILRYDTEKEVEKGEEVEIEVNKTTPVKEIELTGNCLMIYRLIKATPNLTTEQITEYSKIGFEGVKYNLKKLKDNGYIIRRGGRKFGYWVILK